MKALEGISVLDLTRALAGPFCSLMLGDNGADVIKVEIPGTGDDTRHWGPPFIQGESAYYLSINRNKRSLTLNLRDAKAKDIFLKMAASADVVLENFTPGVMSRFGLDYQAVKAVNPKIVYCSISGFGQDGPYQNRPAYDQIMQGLSGIMSITGEPDGEAQKVGLAITDIGAGMWAAFGIMAALRHREIGGEGQYIDISMLDAQVAWLTYQAAYFFAMGEAPKRLGAAHPTLVPYQGFPDYAGNSDRVANRDKLVPMLQELFLTRPVQDWVDELHQFSVPCGPINDIADVFSDPQLLHRQMYVEMPHPTLGTIKQTGLPIKFSLTPGGLDRHPPLLGEHNQEILEDLGYSEADIKQLAEEAVI